MRSSLKYIYYKQLVFISVLFVFVFLTTYPRYIEIIGAEKPTKIFPYFFEKIEHPLTQLHNIGNDTHGSKITFRLTVPLLAKITGIANLSDGRGLVLLYIVQSLLLFPFLIGMFRLLCRYTDRLTATLFLVGISGSYVAKAFFWDYDFWFDGYAYFFLMMGMFCRSSVPIFFFLQLACWTDERAFIALPGIFLFHLLKKYQFGPLDRGLMDRELLKRSKALVVVFAAAVYYFLRVLLAGKFGLHTPSGEDSGIGWRIVPYQMQNRLIGLPLAFEGLWIVLGAGLYYAWRESADRKWLVVLVFFLVIQIFVSFCVYDITRSLGYAFPVFTLACILLYRYAGLKSRVYMILSSLTCMLVPTQYLIFYVREIPYTLLCTAEIRESVRLFWMFSN